MGRIVVYYHQQWLPDLEGVMEESNLYNVKSFREIEVILEPQVLFLCLLRKFCRMDIVLKPCLYDRFYDGILPASLVSVKNPKHNSNTTDVTSTTTGNTNNVDNNNADDNKDSKLVDNQKGLENKFVGTNSFENLYRNYSTDNYDCCVLRNEELINYLIKSSNYSNDVNSLELESEFSLYNKQDNKYNQDLLNSNLNNNTNSNNTTDVTCTTTGNTNNNKLIYECNIKYLKNDVVIMSYIYSHLRYSILYLIWLHPVLNNYTFQVFVNSEPIPYAYYSYLKKKLEVKNKCNHYGYSNLEHTLRDLKFMLQGLRMVIINGFYNNYPLSDIFWFEGHIFSNLTVLFSLPCQDLDELLILHKEFNDLKSYCIKMNSRYEVVSLKSPFLTGDEMPISHFKDSVLSNMINYVV